MNQESNDYQPDILDINPYDREGNLDAFNLTRLCIHHSNFNHATTAYGYFSSHDDCPGLYDADILAHDVNERFKPWSNNSEIDTFLSKLSSLDLKLSDDELGDIMYNALDPMKDLNCTIGIRNTIFFISDKDDALWYDPEDYSVCAQLTGTILRMLLENKESFVIMFKSYIK